jgi:hypothetical protein
MSGFCENCNLIIANDTPLKNVNLENKIKYFQDKLKQYTGYCIHNQIYEDLLAVKNKPSHITPQYVNDFTKTKNYDYGMFDKNKKYDKKIIIDQVVKMLNNEEAFISTEQFNLITDIYKEYLFYLRDNDILQSMNLMPSLFYILFRTVKLNFYYVRTKSHNTTKKKLGESYRNFIKDYIVRRELKLKQIKERQQEGISNQFYNQFYNNQPKTISYNKSTKLFSLS